MVSYRKTRSRGFFTQDLRAQNPASQIRCGHAVSYIRPCPAHTYGTVERYRRMPIARHPECATPTVCDVDALKGGEKIQHRFCDLPMNLVVLVKVRCNFRTEVIRGASTAEHDPIIRGGLCVNSHIPHIVKCSPAVNASLFETLG